MSKFWDAKEGGLSAKGQEARAEFESLIDPFVKKWIKKGFLPNELCHMINVYTNYTVATEFLLNKTEKKNG